LIEHALVVHPAGDLAERAQSPAKIARQEFGGPAVRDLGERVRQAGPGLRKVVGVTDVDRYSLLSDGGLKSLRKALNFREERSESVASQRADGNGRKAGRRNGRRLIPAPEEVGLVQHHQRI